MKNIKIAFPTNDSANIDAHFHHCKNFKVLNIEEGKIVSEELITTPTYKHGDYPQFLVDNKVNVVIAGAIGEGSFNFLKENHIKVIFGIKGEILENLTAFLKGNLKSQGHTYNHENSDHNHGAHSCCCKK